MPSAASDAARSYVSAVAAGDTPASHALQGWAQATEAAMADWQWQHLDDFVAFSVRLKQATGSRAGEPLVWLPWQLALAAQLLCDDDCKVLLVVVARGAGKTELAAALLTYAMCTWGERQQYYSVAPTLRTASIVFDRIRTMIRECDPEATASDTAAISHQGGWVRCRKSIMRALPCTDAAMDGLSARLIVADEVARMEKAISRVITGLSKDPRAKMLAITTPDARQRTRPIYSYMQSLQAHYIGDRSVTAPQGWRAMLYGLDADDDALNDEVWLKAQPSLDVTVSRGSMRASIEAMMGTHDPESVAECDMQILARHNDRLAGAIDLSILDRQMINTPDDWHRLRGAPAMVAVDLARGATISTHANLSSLCLAVWDAAHKVYRYRLIHWWAGQDIVSSEARSHQPLRKWVASGELRQMQGELHDMSVIEAAIQDIMTRYTVRQVGVDPLSHQESAIADWRRRNIPVSAVDQGIKTMAPAWALWTDGLRGRTVVHDRDDVLRTCLSHTRTITDNVGNTRPVKGRSAGNIDAVVASCMAAVLCERFTLARGSSYEGRKVIL